MTMTNWMSRVARCVLWLGLASCQDTLLGEDECLGERTRCESDTNNLGFVELHDPERPAETFEVKTTRSIEAQLFHEMTCEAGCSTWGFEAGPDGGHWLLIADGPRRRLRLIGVDGSLRHESDVDTGSIAGVRLSTDDHLNAVLGGWQPMMAGPVVIAPRYFMRVEGSGKVVKTLLQEPSTEARAMLLAGPGEEVRVVSFGPNDVPDVAYAYAGDGGSVWRQTNLQTKPVDDSFDSPPPLRLADSSLALFVPKPDPNSNATWEGITLLDRDGNVRWESSTSESNYRLSMDRWQGTGILVTRPHTDDLCVSYALSADGSVQGLWQAQRAGFYAVVPRATAVDSEGNVYLAMISGERDTPTFSICRLSNTEAPSECFAVKHPRLEDPINTMGIGSMGQLFWPATIRVAGMTAPEPSVLLLALDRYISDANGSELLRVDLRQAH
jgi:hypothetical protein